MMSRYVFSIAFCIACSTPTKIKIAHKEALVIVKQGAKYRAIKMQGANYDALNEPCVFPILKVVDVSDRQELFDLGYRGTDLGYHLFINYAQAKELSPITYTAVALATKDCVTEYTYSLVEEENSGQTREHKETVVTFEKGKCRIKLVKPK